MTTKLLDRKTRPIKNLNVQEFKAHVNYLLTCDISQDEKKTLCSVLQDVLFSTRQYNGFNYTKWISTGYAQWVKDGSPEDNSSYIGLEYDRYYY